MLSEVTRFKVPNPDKNQTLNFLKPSQYIELTTRVNSAFHPSSGLDKSSTDMPGKSYGKVCSTCFKWQM